MRVDEVGALLAPYITAHPGTRFLDLGGGTGRFADLLLTRYESCSAVVADNSELLLSRNQPNPRKVTSRVEAADLAKVFQRKSFDVIFVHRLLHHLVGDSYSESIGFIQDVLGQCAKVLKPHGRLSVIENVWDGRFVDGLASRLLYYGTSLRMAAPVARRLGANTAGTGVCYLSDRSWRHLFRHAGMHVEAEQVFVNLRFPWYVRYPTLLKRARSIHYWCAATEPS